MSNTSLSAPPRPEAETVHPTRVRHSEVRAAGRLRAGLLVLAALGIVGTAIELATIRHWGSPDQMIPWVVLVALAVAVAAVAWAPSRARIRFAQLVGGGSLLAGAYGVLQHISENVDAGPHSHRYGAKWASMSTLAHWWAGAIGGLGSAPTLAPAVLAQIGLCLLLATLAHPRLAAAREGGR
jgi:hypothetical protein